MADFMFKTWMLDLASATLALWGLVYCTRHAFFMSPDFHSYRGLVGGLLDLLLLNDDTFSLEQVAHNLDEDDLFDAEPESFIHLCLARELYKELLGDWGIERSSVNEVHEASSQKWPTIFRKS